MRVNQSIVTVREESPAVFDQKREGQTDFQWMAEIAVDGSDNTKSLLLELKEKECFKQLLFVVAQAGQKDLFQFCKDNGIDPNFKINGNTVADVIWHYQNSRSLKAHFVRTFPEARFSDGSLPGCFLKNRSFFDLSSYIRDSANPISNIIESAPDGWQDVCCFLLDHGYSADENVNGDNPIHLALDRLPNNTKDVSFIRKLAEAGADIKAEDDAGQTAVNIAKFRMMDPQFIKALDEIITIKPEQKGFKPLEPLPLVSGRMSPIVSTDAVQMISADGAWLTTHSVEGLDAKALDHMDNSALHWLLYMSSGKSTSSCVSEVEFLVSGDVDPNQVNKHGKTALDWAIEMRSDPELIEAIVSIPATEVKDEYLDIEMPDFLELAFLRKKGFSEAKIKAKFGQEDRLYRASFFGQFERAEKLVGKCPSGLSKMIAGALQGKQASVLHLALGKTEEPEKKLSSVLLENDLYDLETLEFLEKQGIDLKKVCGEWLLETVIDEENWEKLPLCRRLGLEFTGELSRERVKELEPFLAQYPEARFNRGKSWLQVVRVEKRQELVRLMKLGARLDLETDGVDVVQHAISRGRLDFFKCLKASDYPFQGKNIMSYYVKNGSASHPDWMTHIKKLGLNPKDPSLLKDAEENSDSIGMLRSLQNELGK